MALEKLRIVPLSSRRALDIKDVRAAFTRYLRSRYGRGVPAGVLRYTRGRLTVRTDSVPWQAEFLWTERDICADLCTRLPKLPPCDRIVVTLRYGSS